MNITLRRLYTDDWQVFKSIRLEALQLEPQFFGAPYDKEATLSEEQWKNRLSHDDTHAFWALYDGDECIGMTGIRQHSADPKEAYLIASYIRTAYRRKNLSALYYQARLDWARSHGYTAALIGHRDSNHASKAANQKFGFVYTHSQPYSFPDGTDGIEFCYKLIL